jgi:hypothetical protein
MAADLLEVNHHISQVFILNFLASSFVGDGPVLTEDTTEVAVGEEDGAGSSSTHERHLFTKMRVITKNNRFDWSPTESLFSFLSIHSTLSGAELTILEEGIGLLDPQSQFTLHLQFLIGRNPSNLLLLPGMKKNRGKQNRTTQQQRVPEEIPARELHMVSIILQAISLVKIE